LENPCPAVALYFPHYNFCRIYKTLRVAPAMEAGIEDHVRSVVNDLVSHWPRYKNSVPEALPTEKK